MDYPTCVACNKIVLDARVHALGKAFHPECFKCTGCSRAIGGTSFIEHEGKAYHDECRPTELRVCGRCVGTWLVGGGWIDR
jgi:hypothetical protein